MPPSLKPPPTKPSSPNSLPPNAIGTVRPYAIALLWVLGLEIVGGGIGMLTAPDVGSWYGTLARAPYNPPSWVFGVVWPALYGLIAIAGYRIWQQRARPQMKGLGALFVVQMLLNWGWSFVFFSMHLLWPALFWIGALVMVVAVMVILLWNRDRITAYLLLPYLAWITFALYLSGYIAFYN